jgi:hypothetical protein
MTYSVGCGPLEKYFRKDMDFEHEMWASGIIFLEIHVG